MKKLIWFITLVCSLLSINCWAEDDYQRKMLHYLYEGLTAKDDLWGGNYRKFYGYVKEQHLNSESFRRFEKNMGWQVSYRDDGDYCYFGINDTSFDVNKLPLYPILEDYTATIVSFYEKEEFNYLQIPGFIKTYFEKIEIKNNQIYELNKENPSFSGLESINKAIGVNQLKKDIPLFFKQKLWLISENGCAQTGVESMYFRTICASGYYQITANLEKTAGDWVFAFQSAKEDLPVIINPRFDSSKLPSDLQDKELYIAPLDDKGKRVFIGSNNNTTCGFYIIWDTDSRKIVYLSMSSGYCLGNEPRFLNRNYLLKFRGNYYILRYSHIRRYAEVLYFIESKMTQIYHADSTAPEI